MKARSLWRDVDMSVRVKGMDSDGHTRDKLELYRQYLSCFLFVLSNQRFYDKIDIYDIFAGRGIYGDDQDGSALIAARLIDKTFESSEKHISLFLNEYDSQNCKELKMHLEDYSFSTVSNFSANEFINTLSPQTPEGTIEFFFIDPYGYTQISKHNYDFLFQRRRCEYLIFMPIRHIHRFIRGEEVLSSIRQFIEDMNIDRKALRESIENSKGINDFSRIINDGLEITSGKKFCLYKILENKNNNANKYGLYFVSDHIRGAEKFLESIKKLDDMINPQTTFEFIKGQDIREKIYEVIGNGRISNVYLYYEGIRRGILPSDMKSELEQLERERKISVEGEGRQKGGFYINYQNYKKRNEKIYVKLAPQ